MSPLSCTFGTMPFFATGFMRKLYQKYFFDLVSYITVLKLDEHANTSGVKLKNVVQFHA